MSSRSAAEPGRPDARVSPAPEEPLIDPVPHAVRDAARRAFAARDRNARVLGLATDSLVDDPSGTGPRQLVFAGTERPGQVQVTVLDPGGGAQVSLLVECSWEGTTLERVDCADQVAPVQEQAPGRWLAGPVPHGLLRAVLHRGDTVLHTAWLRV